MRGEMRLFGREHHHHGNPMEGASPVEIELYHMLAHVINGMEKIMATLDQVLQDVTDESTQIDGISTFIDGLKQQLADALSGTTLSPGTQAKVDAIFSQAETNKGKIATALAANTPVAAPVAGVPLTPIVNLAGTQARMSGGDPITGPVAASTLPGSTMVVTHADQTSVPVPASTLPAGTPVIPTPSVLP